MPPICVLRVVHEHQQPQHSMEREKENGTYSVYRLIGMWMKRLLSFTVQYDIETWRVRETKYPKTAMAKKEISGRRMTLERKKHALGSRLWCTDNRERFSEHTLKSGMCMEVKRGHETYHNSFNSFVSSEKKREKKERGKKDAQLCVGWVCIQPNVISPLASVNSSTSSSSSIVHVSLVDCCFGMRSVVTANLAWPFGLPRRSPQVSRLSRVLALARVRNLVRQSRGRLTGRRPEGGVGEDAAGDCCCWSRGGEGWGLFGVGGTGREGPGYEGYRGT